MPERRKVPRTSLWNEHDGYTIVLECVCGHAVKYPGHPDAEVEVACDGCGRVYVAAAPEEVHVDA